MISGLDVIPIRLSLGLTEQPLRKNEKVGVGRAQIVLSQEGAKKIYLMRTESPDLPPLAREVAGKSTLVAQVFSVSPKTVRDIWGRKTWMQATRPLWTEQELSAHFGEHSRRQAVQTAAAAVPKPEPRISKTEAAAASQAMRPRGRPPGSKDSRPRKRRLRPDEEDDDAEEMLPHEMLHYRDPLHGCSASQAYGTLPPLIHSNDLRNPAILAHHHSEHIYPMEHRGHPHRPHPAHHESSQRRYTEPPCEKPAAWHTQHRQQHMQQEHMPQQQHLQQQQHHVQQQHMQQMQHMPNSEPARMGGSIGRGGPAFPYPLKEEGSNGSLQHRQRLPHEEATVMVSAPLPPSEGDDYAWADVVVSSGTSGHLSEDGGVGGGFGAKPWAFAAPLGEEWAVGEYEEAWQAPVEVQRPARCHGMTLRSALAPSAESRMITEAAPPFRIKYVNKAWCEMCQYGVDEVGGATPAMLQGPLTDKVTIRDLMERLLSTCEAVTGTIINYKKSGEPFLNRLTMLPLYDDDDTITHYLGILVDISG